MINKDLGLVTAYAYAVSKGYTGTEDEFAELMASYASVAEQAEESAEDSEAWAIGKRGGQDVPSTDETYHNNAKYYAEQAGTSAGNAASSAAAASTSESNAASSEDAAADSAAAASASAATATEKAGEAATSASAASTSAANAAGSATNAASSATAASASATAAGNAQTAAETAQGKAEDAQEAAEQAQSDAEAAAQSVSQSAAQISQNTSDISDLKSAVNDPVTGLDTKAPVIIDSASGAIASFPDGADGMPLKSLTINIEPVQAAGTPSPENPLPISGWTGTNVVRTGKNLLSGLMQGGINPTGALTPSVTNRVSSQEFIPIKPGETYTISGSTNVSGESIKAYVLEFAAVDTEYIKGEAWSALPKTFTADSSAKYIKIMIGLNGDSDLTPANIQNAQIEAGSTASSFEPFEDIDVYPISWQTEAGTVYGGTVDVTNGVLTVLMKSMQVTSLRGLYTRRNGDFYAAIIGVSPAAMPASNDETDGDCLCNVALNMSASARFASTLSAIVIRSNGDIELCIAGITTEADLNEFVSNNNIQVVYELATPQTYQLTPTEVNTLLGTNNIWADCGDSTVEYPADTKLYIDKKLAALVAALS